MSEKSQHVCPSRTDPKLDKMENTGELIEPLAQSLLFTDGYLFPWRKQWHADQSWPFHLVYLPLQLCLKSPPQHTQHSRCHWQKTSFESAVQNDTWKRLPNFTTLSAGRAFVCVSQIHFKPLWKNKYILWCDNAMVRVWVGLGTKMTRLGCGKYHGFDLNGYIVKVRGAMSSWSQW